MLNKKGWGLRVELLFIVLFLVCLLIATIGLNRFGLFGNSNVNNDAFSYSDLEYKLNDAAKRYYQNNYEVSLDNTLIINSSTLLFNGYLSNFVDGNNNNCSGYTRVISKSGSITYTSYIKCPNYKTPGYDYE